MAGKRTNRSDDSQHISLRGLDNGCWEVLQDGMSEPLISVESQKAAFEFAVLFAVDHPPTTVEMVD